MQAEIASIKQNEPRKIQLFLVIASLCMDINAAQEQNIVLWSMIA